VNVINVNAGVCWSCAAGRTCNALDLLIRNMFYGMGYLSHYCTYVVFNILFITLKTVVAQQGYNFYYSIILSSFWVTLHHWSHDHKTRSGQFPLDDTL